MQADFSFFAHLDWMYACKHNGIAWIKEERKRNLRVKGHWFQTGLKFFVIFAKSMLFLYWEYGKREAKQVLSEFECVCE